MVDGLATKDKEAIVARKNEITKFSKIVESKVIGKCVISTSEKAEGEEENNNYYYVSLDSSLEPQTYWYHSSKISIPPSFHLVSYDKKDTEIIIDYGKTSENQVGQLDDGNEEILFAFSLNTNTVFKKCYRRGVVTNVNKIRYDYKAIIGKEEIEDKSCGTTCRESLFYDNNSKLIAFACPKQGETKINLLGNNIEYYFIPCLGKEGEDGRGEANIIYRRFSKTNEAEFKNWIKIAKPEASGIKAEKDDDPVYKNTSSIDNINIKYADTDLGLEIKPTCKPVCV